jgi:uncharacterized protein
MLCAGRGERDGAAWHLCNEVAIGAGLPWRASVNIEIEFDAAKDAQNRRKHGLSLRFSLAVLAGLVGEELDQDEVGEERWIAYGRVGLHLFVCVYTMRGGRHRIIPVRKATRAEEERWLTR